MTAQTRSKRRALREAADWSLATIARRTLATVDIPEWTVTRATPERVSPPEAAGQRAQRA